MSPVDLDRHKDKYLSDIQRYCEIFGPYLPHFSIRSVDIVAQNLLAEGALSPEHEGDVRAFLATYVPIAQRHPNGPMLGMRQTVKELLA